MNIEKKGYLALYLEGYQPMYKAFWFLGIANNILIFLLNISFIKYSFPMSWVLFLIFILSFDIFWSYCVCHCSKNVSWKGWRIIAGFVMSVVFLRHISMISVMYSIRNLG